MTVSEKALGEFHGTPAAQPAPEAVSEGRARARWPIVHRLMELARNSRGTATESNRLRDRRPNTVAEVFAYTKAGGWVPGKWPWWVEAPGKVYGYGLAVPVTVLGYALLWLVHRPTRVVAAYTVAVALRVAFTGHLAVIPW